MLPSSAPPAPDCEAMLPPPVPVAAPGKKNRFTYCMWFLLIMVIFVLGHAGAYYIYSKITENYQHQAMRHLSESLSEMENQYDIQPLNFKVDDTALQNDFEQEVIRRNEQTYGDYSGIHSQSFDDLLIPTLDNN